MYYTTYICTLHFPSSSLRMDITIVSAQPMTSDVIPPPAKAATPTVSDVYSVNFPNTL